MINQVKPIVIYHANCTDGYGAAWCFWNKYKDQAIYIPGNYNDPIPDVTGRIVYLVDFSYKRHDVEKMLEVAEKVVFIDHHKSAIEDLAGIFDHHKFEAYISKDNTQSGAGLAWHYLNGAKKPPLLIQHIQDRDLWLFELAETEAVMVYVNSFEYSFDLWDTYMSYTHVDPDYLKMVDNGTLIVKNFNNNLKITLTQTLRRIEIGGIEVPVANTPYIMASKAGDIMNKGEKFSATYYDSALYRHFSLRSDKQTGIDVSLIAGLYGGGGHVNSSGFKVTRDHELGKI